MKKLLSITILLFSLIVLTGCEDNTSSIMIITGSGGGNSTHVQNNITIQNNFTTINNFTNNITQNFTTINNITNNIRGYIYNKTDQEIQNINTTSVTAWRMVPNFSLSLASATTYKITCEFLTSTNLTTSGSQINISYLEFGHNITQTCFDFPTATTIYSLTNNFTNSRVNTFGCLSTGNPIANVNKVTYYMAVIQTNQTTYLNWSIKCETGICNVRTAPLSFCKAEVI